MTNFKDRLIDLAQDTCKLLDVADRGAVLFDYTRVVVEATLEAVETETIRCGRLSRALTNLHDEVNRR